MAYVFLWLCCFWTLCAHGFNAQISYGMEDQTAGGTVLSAGWSLPSAENDAKLYTDFDSVFSSVAPPDPKRPRINDRTLGLRSRRSANATDTDHDVGGNLTLSSASPVTSTARRLVS